mmetsp:Transcript_44017/g.71878  ORF Transcript_44017/g.71878 Transcript_44017/m.71878 type:complete len:94 (+) Transcript_44017:152-433(+)
MLYYNYNNCYCGHDHHYYWRAARLPILGEDDAVECAHHSCLPIAVKAAAPGRRRLLRRHSPTFLLLLLLYYLDRARGIGALGKDEAGSDARHQ